MARKRGNRRGRSPTTYTGTTNGSANASDDKNVEPMDEDDQKALVENIRKEATAQSRFFQLLFGYGVGGFGVALSLVLPLLCDEECKDAKLECWCHALFSFLLHVWSVYPFVVKTSFSDASSLSPMDYSTSLMEARWKQVVGLALQMLPVVLWLGGGMGDDPAYFHLVLLIGNVISYLGSRVILWDIHSTNRALADLEGSQYRHKSL